jgi:hypothetical protein
MCQQILALESTLVKRKNQWLIFTVTLSQLCDSRILIILAINLLYHYTEEPNAV